MLIIRFSGTVLGIFVGAIAGNWLGHQLRAFVDGEPAPEFDLFIANDGGERIINVVFLRENLLPAVMASFVGKPRWMYALIGGMIYSGFFDEESKKLLGSSIRLFR